MKKLDALILFRHGETPANEFIDSEDYVERTLAQQQKDFDDFNMDLNQQGEIDAMMVGQILLCFNALCVKLLAFLFSLLYKDIIILFVLLYNSANYK